MNAELLSIDALTYTYPGSATAALDNLSCSVRSGECVCLTGNSGCGKSTLLLAIKGLLHGGRRAGRIDLTTDGTDDAASFPLGIVFQNAESQIMCTTVAEEVAFGPENLCLPTDEIARRVRNSLQGVGLAGCETRNVERFSAGEKQRIAIASVLAMNPTLLLLDEPSSQLDDEGKRELCALLAGLKRQGYTLIISEHDARPFAAIIDRYLAMENGRIVATSTTAPPHRSSDWPLPSRAMFTPASPAAIAVDSVSLSYPETGPALREVTVKVLPGQRVLLFGSNGAGKSSLLRCLAGLELPDEGAIEVAGVGNPRPEELPGKVGVLFQNPARQLFAETVQEEVAFTLHRLRLDRRQAEAMVAEALELCNIEELRDRTPLTLSFGEQHRVALAAAIAPRPRVLLLDEPFAGLDMPQRLALLQTLARMSDRYGTTVLIASHNELPDQRWADRILILCEGRLAEQTP